MGEDIEDLVVVVEDLLYFNDVFWEVLVGA